MPIHLEASGKAPPIPQKQPGIDPQLQPLRYWTWAWARNKKILFFFALLLAQTSWSDNFRRTKTPRYEVSCMKNAKQLEALKFHILQPREFWETFEKH